ncbi:myb/SANT-like DNA-binding domain-containing protein 3 [Periplaneta americana]|uniref:myb/SANT-like DNA-binding domain-containing protein 3 n=1 Tax=Periplaneta americana TaxID=6978 RepID=UPI0037E85AED
MEGTPKRLYFTAEEKMYINELASRYQDVVENKKSDVVSVSAKRRKWTEIASEFNLNSKHSKRTPQQIKKCWENMKTKRKLELAQEKRQRMSAGGWVFPELIAKDDHETDDVMLDTTDIKVEDVIYGDTAALLANQSSVENYMPVEDGGLGNSSEDKSNEAAEEGVENSWQTTGEDMTTARVTRDTSNAALVKESDKRLERWDLLKQQDKEIHEMKMKEMEIKVKTADIEYQRRTLELQQMKEKHDIEMKILKKKLNE